MNLRRPLVPAPGDRGHGHRRGLPAPARAPHAPDLDRAAAPAAWAGNHGAAARPPVAAASAPTTEPPRSLAKSRCGACVGSCFRIWLPW